MRSNLATLEILDNAHLARTATDLFSPKRSTRKIRPKLQADHGNGAADLPSCTSCLCLPELPSPNRMGGHELKYVRRLRLPWPRLLNRRVVLSGRPFPHPRTVLHSFRAQAVFWQFWPGCLLALFQGDLASILNALGVS